MKKNYYYALFICVLTLFTVHAQRYKEMIEAGTYSVQQIQQAAEEHFAEVGTGRGVGFKSYKRWEFKALMDMDENGMLKPSDFYYHEYERLQQELNSNRSLAAFQGSWEQLGPDYKNGTSGWNPGVGRVTSIAVQESNQNHIIVGSPGGGVWKTTDGGVNWTVLTDNLSNIDVYALAMDPVNSNIYYWGSTNGNIFKSIDAGATWNLLADTGSGTVNKILIDPTNTTKLYCTSSGGIFKSTDTGVTWSKINPLANNGYDIEFKPGDTNTIYASGTEYFVSRDGGNTFDYPFSGFKSWTQESVTGSRFWTISNSNQNGSVTPKTGNGMAMFFYASYDHPVTRLVSEELNLQGATNPQLNFSFTNVNWGSNTFLNEMRVLYKTSLGGAWTELANYTAEVTSWTDITLNLPNASSTYYIAFEATNNYGRGLTLDDVSVTDATLGTVFQSGFEGSMGSGVKMMAVSPADDTVVFMLEENSGAFGKLYKSTDSGATFTEIDHTGRNYFGYSSNSTDTDDAGVGQAPRDMDIAIHPTDINDVHIAGVNTWRSTDGGITFSISSQWTPGNASSSNIGYCHADVDLLQFVGSNLYVGSDGGIFIAENPTVVNTNYYRDLSSGLGIREFYRIGVSQTAAEVVTGGAQDNGSSILIGGVWKDWLGADGMEGFVDKDNNDVIYGTVQFGSLYKSTNGGNSSFGLSEPEGKSGNWVTPFEQDPTAANTIYAGYDQVYKSTNGGTSWVLPAISQDFGGNINHLKIAPSNNQIMFAARGSNLYKTENGGATNWVQKTGFAGSINSIAIHPSDPNKIALATTGAGKVYVSTDGGDNWTSYLYNLPAFSASAVVWQDNGNDGLYVGMNYGVFYIDSTFPGAWQPFSNNLPNVRITELEVKTIDNKLYAASYGRGLWKSDLYSEALSVEDIVFENLTIHPNPTSSQLNFSWDKNEPITIKIFNVNGKLVYYAKDLILNNSYTIDVSNLATGIYFAKLNTINSSVTKKLSVN
ncbi:T9SS type A sorting domain-containing protein [Pseudofulvibacter geojedonensis]|uniref:T9SS type A sorting domain-containing protein n=1 Tax=Pseudofulvibacter geojedonensis TaxID=1123758 RepID=A0ABW3HZN2_9FLAO